MPKGIPKKGINKGWYSSGHKKRVGIKHSKETIAKMSGENNHSWKEEKDLKIGAIHHRIEKKLGKPDYCEHCKRTDKKRYEWSNKDHKYSSNIEDWQRLCRSCHVRFDIANNNYGGFWWNTAEKIQPTKNGRHISTASPTTV